MTTYTELMPETKSEKHGCFTFAPVSDDASPRAGTLTISGKRSHTTYAVKEFPADQGRGFCLLKKTPGTDVTEDHYSVFVGSNGVGRCERRGFYSTGRPCKHLQSLLELVKANRI